MLNSDIRPTKFSTIKMDFIDLHKKKFSLWITRTIKIAKRHKVGRFIRECIDPYKKVTSAIVVIVVRYVTIIVWYGEVLASWYTTYGYYVIYL